MLNYFKGESIKDGEPVDVESYVIVYYLNCSSHLFKKRLKG
jgi:hypothetical protein